jgi:SAM-dependent methyltransferase
MPLNWIDTTHLSFNAMLLLERPQLAWLPGWLPEADLALALKANPAVAWFMRHKCPEISPWLDGVEAVPVGAADGEAVYAAEQHILQTVNDLLVYALDPSIYDLQPFLGWDSTELTSLVDFRGKVVLDIGAGTGRLALTAAPLAQVVWAVEPVGNLRCYLLEKARRLGFEHVFAVDGLITGIPFPDGFAQVTLCGHVFGGDPELEVAELERVTCPGGIVILCPGTSESEQAAHAVLVGRGYYFSRFEEPGAGWKRKYWKER